jgi:hypothetical protein
MKKKYYMRHMIALMPDKYSLPGFVVAPFIALVTLNAGGKRAERNEWRDYEQ